GDHARRDASGPDGPEAAAAGASHPRGHGDRGLPALRRPQALAPRVRFLRLLSGQEAGRGRGRLSVIRVAVDAMGGDKAPQAEIAGVLQALASLPDEFVVQLVGRPATIEAELATHANVDRSRLEIH